MANSTFQRGDIVVCAFSGDYGKPRPAVVVQSNAFNPTHASITLCPITSELAGLPMFRVPIAPTASTGIRKDSEVMVDKITTVRRDRISRRVGHLSRPQMTQVGKALEIWLDFGREAEPPL